MDDVVEASFDYGKLDRNGQAIRLRLNSTCVNVRETGGKVQVAYVRDGRCAVSRRAMWCWPAST